MKAAFSLKTKLAKPHKIKAAPSYKVKAIATLL